MKPKPYGKKLIVPLLVLFMMTAVGAGGALGETATYDCRSYPGPAVAPMDFAPDFATATANQLPNALDPGFIFATNPGTGYDYQIGMYEFQHDPGLGFGATTTVWGYGQQPQTGTDPNLAKPSYPARTFFVNAGVTITVRFTNNLTVDGTETGTPRSHLFPVDSTLTWADPLEIGKTWGPYCGPVPTVVHLHGGHTDSCSDGLPDAWFTPNDEIVGRMWNPVYTFDNTQEAATVWYHDHALGITRLNVYAGLAGFYIIRDANETTLNLPGSPYNANGGPSTDYEIAFVIQDRMFYNAGTVAAPVPQLFYPSAPPLPGAPLPSTWPEFFGNVILVNGKAWPNLDVEQNRWYRLRVLNGSDSAFYDLFIIPKNAPLNLPPPASLNPPPGRTPYPPVTFYQIGTDLGFLDNPVPLNRLVIGPGERADLLVNFGALTVGTQLIMRNVAGQPFPNGVKPDPATVGQIMQFTVTTNSGVTDPFAAMVTAAGVVTNVNLRPPAQTIATLRAELPAPAATRQLILYEAVNSYGRLEPMLGTAAEGVKMYENNITELIQGVGDTEIWEIYNLTPDAHPIHLHLVDFFVLDRTPVGVTIENPFSGKLVVDANNQIVFNKVGAPVPPPANELGLKDTVATYPGQRTRVIATFDKWGEYVWHCHILSHEDHEMMRPFFVGPSALDPDDLRVKKGIGVKGKNALYWQKWYEAGGGCPRVGSK